MNASPRAPAIRANQTISGRNRVIACGGDEIDIQTFLLNFTEMSTNSSELVGCRSNPTHAARRPQEGTVGGWNKHVVLTDQIYINVGLGAPCDARWA
jgi:hypothetical protein